MLLMNKLLRYALCALVLLTLGACSMTRAPNMSTSAPSMGASSMASAVGVVQSIERVDQKDAGIGVGAITGVVVGDTRLSRMRDDQAYRVTLRMDDGAQQVFATETNPSLRVGDRVQIVNGIVEHY